MVRTEEAITNLQAILARIREGISSGERDAIADELTSFAMSLPPEPEFAELRSTARSTRKMLDKEITASAFRSLESRTDALMSYAAAINSVTKKAEKDAAEARLEILERILSVTRMVTSSALAAKKAFEENRPQDGFAAIEKVLEEIEKLDDES